MDDSTRYELLELIGKGSFGDVYRGLDTIEQRDVAIKVVDLEDIEEGIDEIQREIAFLRTCRSPNITHYYGSAVLPGTTRLLIAMELMAVSLADLVSGDGIGILTPLSEPAIAFVLREVLNALVYLHSEHRIHRDVKAANILLSSSGDVKVSDFGVSAQLSGTVGFKRRTFVGSPLWMAPEVIEQSPDNPPMSNGNGNSSMADGYDEAADIWSLGITAIELAVGEPPRANIGSFRLLFMIVRDDPPLLEGPFSTAFKDFVWQCLRKNPHDRPSAIDLLQHPFVMAAGEKPAELEERVAAYLATKPKLKPNGGIGDDNPMSATLPRWDFGSSAPTMSAEPSAGAITAAPTPSAAASGKPPRPSTSVSNPQGSSADAEMQQRPATAPNGSRAVALAAAAAVTGTIRAASPAVGPRRHTDSDWSGTVDVKPQKPAVVVADSAATVVAGGNGTSAGRHIVIPSDPHVPDGPYMAGNGTPLDSSHTVAGAAASSRAPAPESGPIRLLVQPALTSAAGSSARAAAAAEAALAALSQLEAAQPGATRSALTDMLALLSVSSSPALAPLKSSAAAVFGSSDVDAGQQAVMSQAGQGLMQQHQDFGPLGNFLLSRWREEAARERAESGGRQWQATRG